MAANTSPSLPQLFSELDRLGKEGNYSKAQKIANKILQESPADEDAFHCKVVCLIQQSYFHEALDVINSGSKKGIKVLPFEKAYALYRLNMTQEAIQTLQALPDPGPKEKELLAQALYRQEKYEKCMDIYKELIKNSVDDYGDERETNMSAVIASSNQWGSVKLENVGLREHTYELSYNAACLELANNNLEGAIKKLQQAEVLCRKSLEEDSDITEEDIEAELGVARTQLGYTYQIQGKNEDAMKLYNQVLKNKPSDMSLTAVASNNVITLNKDRDVFDSKKKVKATTIDGLQYKLTQAQFRNMEFNRCLLFLYSNQLEACRSLISNLEGKYPQSDFPCLMKASLLHREKHYDKAIHMLKEYAEKHPETATHVKLTLVQMCLTQGNIEEACKTLHSIKELCHKPGVVSALVTLYSHLGNIPAAIKLLDSAVEYAQENKGLFKQSEVLSLMRENVAYKLQHGHAKDAVDMLEKLHKQDSHDMKTLAQLITAYSQFNPKEAEKYSERLPPLEGDSAMDVDALETSQLTCGPRFGRQRGRPDEDGAVELNTDVIMKRRKRKRKKGKLPKNCNTEVDPDPERWLPKRERSYYKGKRQKKTNVGKGTQGTASASSTGTESPKTPASPKAGLSSPPGSPGGGATSAPSNVVPPRQQQPAAAKKKQRPKGKKKGGW
ncbi:signal recognition particle subunit SRP72 isoform X2 [Nematostella vectensis]|uniref:signal recognition particle subunit SRP72 isoform X2 n=1 Tax=Nematostella vectensis TaxID=45351 RepID=UPI00138FFADB|nr:signal recognition particle subunit SRP72 isoform X2 [Nematostella vectensis]